ncbi:hypothetical protein H2248_005188 [Termitomyces sp. 'cryptogamus']|nr:hypothetical protein H2248_005188 [Termitomyces sp. 'cryptogamus']
MVKEFRIKIREQHAGDAEQPDDSKEETSSYMPPSTPTKVHILGQVVTRTPSPSKPAENPHLSWATITSRPASSNNAIVVTPTRSVQVQRSTNSEANRQANETPDKRVQRIAVHPGTTH